MLRAIVSDVHANLDALEVVLQDIARAGAAELLCLGDFVGYGAQPNECVDRLRPRVQVAVMGNHDAAATGPARTGDFNSLAAQAAHWTQGVLSPAGREFLAGLPWVARRAGALLVHASPAEPHEWHYVLSPGDARMEFESFAEPLAFVGHSHYPGAFVLAPGSREPRYTRAAELQLEPGHRHLVNVPSVGQPRDGDPRAGYLLWDDEAGGVRHVRLEYDVESARQKILAAGLPRFLGDRLQWGE